MVVDSVNIILTTAAESAIVAGMRLWFALVLFGVLVLLSDRHETYVCGNVNNETFTERCR